MTHAPTQKDLAVLRRFEAALEAADVAAARAVLVNIPLTSNVHAHLASNMPQYFLSAVVCGGNHVAVAEWLLDFRCDALGWFLGARSRTRDAVLHDAIKAVVRQIGMNDTASMVRWLMARIAPQRLFRGKGGRRALKAVLERAQVKLVVEVLQTVDAAVFEGRHWAGLSPLQVARTRGPPGIAITLEAARRGVYVGANALDGATVNQMLTCDTAPLFVPVVCHLLPQIVCDLQQADDMVVVIEMTICAFDLRSMDLVVAIEKLVPDMFHRERAWIFARAWTRACEMLWRPKEEVDRMLAFLYAFYDKYPDTDLLADNGLLVWTTCESGRLDALRWLADRLDLSVVLRTLGVFKPHGPSLSPRVMGFVLNHLLSPPIAEIANSMFDPIVAMLVEPMYASLVEDVWPWFLRILDSDALQLETDMKTWMETKTGCRVCDETGGWQVFVMGKFTARGPYHVGSHGEAIVKQLVHRGPLAMRVCRLIASVCDTSKWCPRMQRCLQEDAWKQRCDWVRACQPRGEPGVKRVRIDGVD
jgi:hypothetical protein